MPGYMLSFVVLLALQGAIPADASFLHGGPTYPSERLSLRDVRSKLQREIDGALGLKTNSTLVRSFEESLRPMFRVLPKNKDGRLGVSTARYALHRVLEDRYGWRVNGLQPQVGMWNSTTPTGVLKDHVPAYLETMFEERLQGRGFDVHELALFGVVLHNLVVEEATQRLRIVYEALKIPQDKAVTVQQLESIIEMYMVGYILNDNFKELSEQYSVLRHQLADIYPGWPATLEFAHTVRRDVMYAPFTFFSHAGADFATARKIVEAIGERFGSFQDHECRQIKKSLLSKQELQSGRVRLSDFYSFGLDGTMHNMETPDFLREIGALDEYEPTRPRLIVSNYLSADSNCIMSSNFYSTCCRDECSGILAQLEKQVGGPFADPTQLAKLVAATPSESVGAPRELSASMLKHLDMVAKVHAGRVPLHSRLFAQWLHHAYPRECTLPPPVNKSRPRSTEEWEGVTGLEATVNMKELDTIVTEAKDKTEDEKLAAEIGATELEHLPWTSEEEEVVVHETWMHADASPPAILRNLAFVLMTGGSIWYALDTLGMLVGQVGKVLPKHGSKGTV